MEGKKLNFEKPLLSARWSTSGEPQENGSKWKIEDSVRSVRRPPPYKSELKSGPVSIPGTVPFEWEQIPGRPKDETRLESHVAESYKVPNLPPGRTTRVGKQDFDNDSANPGVYKDQTRSMSHESSSIQSLDENVKEIGSFRYLKVEKENSCSGNEDEEFVDALETLSRAESLLINCSLSGLSGLQDPNMKESGISPIDSRTRDIMMGRFLPAAKAMASETPQHAPRKPPVRQQLSQLRKMVNEDKHPQLRYGPDFALEYVNRNGNDDEESDEDYDEGGNFQGKICGILPGLGFRSSLRLLNPLPGMTMRSRAPMPPRRKSQTRTSSWSCSETDRQVSLDKVGLHSFRKLTAEDNGSQKKSIGSPVAEKTLYVDTEHEARSLHVKSCSIDANEQTEPEVKKHEILVEKRDQNQILDSPTNTKTLNLMEKKAKSEVKDQIHDLHIVSSRDEANQKSRTGVQVPSGLEQDIFKGSNMFLKEPQQSEKSKIYSVLAPPPLPKSPSDSWLGRTLSSISKKNTSVHSYHGTWITPKDQASKPKSADPKWETMASKPKSADPKWETMVRMTKIQDQHLYFSEDRLTPIPEA